MACREVCMPGDFRGQLMRRFGESLQVRRSRVAVSIALGSVSRHIPIIVENPDDHFLSFLQEIRAPDPLAVTVLFSFDDPQVIFVKIAAA